MEWFKTYHDFVWCTLCGFAVGYYFCFVTYDQIKKLMCWHVWRTKRDFNTGENLKICSICYKQEKL